MSHEKQQVPAVELHIFHCCTPKATPEMFSSFCRLKLLLPAVCLVLMAIPAVISSSRDSSPNSNSTAEEISSWARLQISSYSMASMPYGNYRINIYEHQSNNMPGFNGTKRYFYAPIVLLDHQSAFSEYNNVTQEPELKFRIEMWNDEVEDEIGKYITLLTGKPIKKYQVEIIPFDKVILSSSSSTSNYKLTKDWKPYQFHQALWFNLICFSMRDCDELAQVMKNNTEQFSNLKLFFSQSAQKTQRRETFIRVENIMAGEMAAKLDQRYTNPDTPNALLTAEDEKRLLTESSTNVLIGSFDDSDVVSPTTEAQIYNMLKDMLVSSREIIKDQSDAMWESVFWDDDNYRPDKTTKEWQEVYDAESTETQKKMSDAFKNTHKWEKEMSIGVEGTSASKKLGLDTSKEGSHSEEYYDKLWAESRDTVQWEGEKFTPKSMSLARVNVNTLRNTQTLEDRSVRVSYYTAVLSVALNFHPYTDKPSMDMLFYLQQEITELNSTLQAEIKRSKATENKLDTSLQNEIKRATAAEKQLNTTDSTLRTDIANLNNKLDSSTGVYFTVYRGQSIGTGTVTYEGSKLSIGGGMSTSTGIFTAPKAGVYLFNFHTSKGSHDLKAWIVLNGSSKTGMWSGTDKNHWVINQAMSVVLSLKVNDKVNVNIEVGSTACCAGWTTFSGALLRETK